MIPKTITTSASLWCILPKLCGSPSRYIPRTKEETVLVRVKIPRQLEANDSFQMPWITTSRLLDNTGRCRISNREIGIQKLFETSPQAL